MVNFTPKLKDQPVPFFLKTLRGRLDEEGGYLGLAQAITRAYRTNVANPSSFPKRNCIDRRKLRRLIAHERDVSVTLVELEALHSYLATLGVGLTRKPFFTHSSIVQELADLPDATFMLGSSMSQEGPDLSHWDIQAMAWIQRRNAPWSLGWKLAKAWCACRYVSWSTSRGSSLPRRSRPNRIRM